MNQDDSEVMKSIQAQTNFFYSEEIYSNVLEKGAIKHFFSWTHSSLEKKFEKFHADSVLELGAGGGQHSPFVKHSFNHYLQTDIRPKNLRIRRLEDRVKSHPESIDATNLPFENDYFDRVISTCLLAHLEKGLHGLLEWRRVTKSGGYVSIYVPLEPSILLRFARKFTTRRRASSLGVDHAKIHYVEHRNHWFTMNAWISEVFEADNVKRRRYPINRMPFNLGLWDIYQIKIEK